MRRRRRPTMRPAGVPARLTRFEPNDWQDELQWVDHHCDDAVRRDAWRAWTRTRQAWAEDYAQSHDVTVDEASDLLPDIPLSEVDFRFCYGCI